jgi:hypothetical protein
MGLKSHKEGGNIHRPYRYTRTELCGFVDGMKIEFAVQLTDNYAVCREANRKYECMKNVNERIEGVTENWKTYYDTAFNHLSLVGKR